jgi:formylglycine-generating enzyme required for sulfatase activity
VSLKPDEFLADVVAVFAGQAKGAFGSGRLIAPGLVLTAGHVVDYPTYETAQHTGWKLCLLRERNKDGTWKNSAHEAEVLWRGSGELDMALLRVIGDTKLTPTLEPVFASYDRIGSIPGGEAAGFPEAWFTPTGELRDYSVGGSLRVVSQHGPYAWSVAPADKPDDPRGWKGMSGAAVCHVGPDDKLYLFGVVQEVPANFSGGQLEVARILFAFDDPVFRAHLGAALGQQPELMVYTGAAEAAAPEASEALNLELIEEIDPYLIDKIRDLPEPRLSLRVLLASSSPSRGIGSAPDGSGVGRLVDVNHEVATIESTFNGVIEHPELKTHFDLEVFECVNATQMRRVLPHAGCPVALHDVDDFQLVVLIAWHNLGEDGLLHKLERDLREAHIRFRLVYWREGEPPLRYYDSESMDRYQEVNLFFQQDLDESSYTRYLPSQFSRVFETDFWRLIKQLVEGRPEASRSQLAAAPATHGRARPLYRDRRNPYRGLDRYNRADGPAFFGRSREVKDLCQQLAVEQNHFIAIVGASGSGKSSLARAGLLYRLQFDTIPGSRRWPVVDFSIARCRGALMSSMADLLWSKLPDSRANPYRDISKLEAALAEPAKFEEIVNTLLDCSGGAERLIIFVDQFEELFTLGTDQSQATPRILPAERDSLINFLARAALSPHVYIIMTLRADYFEQVSRIPQLSKMLHDGIIYSVLPPSRESLLAIIRRPAIFSSLRFENQKVAFDILDEAGIEPGSLPLLSYALEQLANRALCSDNLITHAAFVELGGLHGVIQKQADLAIASIPQEELEESLGVLFRNLIRVDEHNRPARQPAPGLDDPIWQHTPGARRVAQQLVEQRLLQAGEGGSMTMQIAHEALLTHWPRLKDWINKYAEALLFRQRLKQAAQEWQTERAKRSSPLAQLEADRDLLWPDSRLQEAERMLRLLSIDDDQLSSLERDFLRPEKERLCAELELPITHARRAWIGNRLAELGDPRPGTGVCGDKIPDIVWCGVPGGRIELSITRRKAQTNWEPRKYRQDADLTFEVRPFYIAKYVITLSQFNAFAKSDAYWNNAWWDGLPVQPAEHRPIQQFSPANHPADFVSWYQAIAFCRWLSHLLGYTVRLPTEWEWQQAATGGHQNLSYPWGTEWNPDNANTKYTGIGLVSVGLYPAGASPVGALDMSGNVYEWCQNPYDDLESDSLGDEPRTTRGGAYFTLEADDARDAVKVTARVRDNANGYNGLQARIRAGIRLACDRIHSLPSASR